jgi:hypothetical protein
MVGKTRAGPGQVILYIISKLINKISVLRAALKGYIHVTKYKDEAGPSGVQNFINKVNKTYLIKIDQVVNYALSYM